MTDATARDRCPTCGSDDRKKLGALCHQGTVNFYDSSFMPGWDKWHDSPAVAEEMAGGGVKSACAEGRARPVEPAQEAHRLLDSALVTAREAGRRDTWREAAEWCRSQQGSSEERSSVLRGIANEFERRAGGGKE